MPCFVMKAAAADATAKGTRECAGVDDRIVRARELDGIGNVHAISAEAQRGVVVHRERAGAERRAVAEVQAALASAQCLLCKCSRPTA
jgi:hypothetical protein